jgi:transcription initiation factor TFIIIB Brf1 subunit/transcription initiation factor TFIIB
MKGGASGRSDGNAAAAAILIAVLLGCFAISAQCNK